ncbi:hypothetical protein [Terribacillus saccharophilus]|uniref:hypothetical protein n=1 Tax=Terribacillus saccharophilus TaxID=361277 RepID=UPI002989FA51|nr:hypothetical protein [Terribacillus saccharophilus]MCM3227546.1 hypothetical protein [Terribacillus saccharophilus]
MADMVLIFRGQTYREEMGMEHYGLSGIGYPALWVAVADTDRWSLPFLGRSEMRQ